jgi:signal transduction histidine kinase
MSSIRGKIMFGYFALAAVVVAFALFAYGDLRFLERHVAEEVAVSAFQEDILEMRRHEKNFFLYRSQPDLNEAFTLAGEVMAQLEDEREVFKAVASEANLEAIRKELGDYRELIAGYRARTDLASAPAKALEKDIRAAGHAISSQVESMSAQERKLLAATVQQSQRALFWSMGLVALLGIVGGHVLSRRVVGPLRQLEANLKAFDDGRFHAFPEASKDREIISFTRALNRMLEQLENHQRQILQSEKLASLGVLAAGVAHEINNPLGNISSSCQILLEELDHADRAALHEWLTQIDSETERARRIVLTLLEYARRRSFNTEPVALQEVLEKTVLLMRSQLPAADTLRIEVAPELKVRADTQRLQQVFINLVKNAIDAGGDRVRVTVAARLAQPHDWPPSHDAYVVGNAEIGTREDRHTVLIRIADNGPGIPPELLAKIFDPFFTTRDTGRGTGLGLYIVEEIVQEHGGCIAVDNSPEGGARFTIWLPGTEENT